MRNEARLSQSILRLITNCKQLIAKALIAKKTNIKLIKYKDIFALKIKDI
jgi:hypothetical protein